MCGLGDMVMLFATGVMIGPNDFPVWKEVGQEHKRNCGEAGEELWEGLRK